MILDDYRTTLIERLKSCLSTAEARAILTEADLVLMNSRLTSLTRDKSGSLCTKTSRRLASRRELSPTGKPDWSSRR